MNDKTKFKALDANNPLDRETLLHEYESCLTTIHDLEARIWQSATIFVAASITGIFAFFGLLNSNAYKPSAITIMSSLGAIAVTWFWYRIVKRWWAFQSVLWYRMREIDRELGMRRNLYIVLLNQKELPGQQEIVKPSQFDDEVRFSTILESSVGKEYFLERAQDSLRRIVLVLILLWLIIAIMSAGVFSARAYYLLGAS